MKSYRRQLSKTNPPDDCSKAIPDITFFSYTTFTNKQQIFIDNEKTENDDDESLYGINACVALYSTKYLKFS